MKVVCISGKAHHGKDTVAGMLKDALEADGYKVLITHYADLLKHICRSFFGWDGNKDEQGRHILQHVGTDVIRTSRPDYWVNFIIGIIKLFPDQWEYVLIPDCRFQNEIESLRKAGFDVIHLRIVRDLCESPLTDDQKRHLSETALDECEPDQYIKNSGTLSDLRKAISDWVVEINGVHQISIEEQ